MFARALICILTCFYFDQATAQHSTVNFDIYIVRHAEKHMDGGPDPGLTKAGKLRAEGIAAWFYDKGLERLWSSDYLRCRATVEPLMSGLELELKLYDPVNQTTLVEELLRDRRTALVVGHSNTVPELAGLLCDCPIAEMNDSEYERLIVISFTDNETSVKTLQQNDLFQMRD